jgi:hypothetical protein
MWSDREVNPNKESYKKSEVYTVKLVHISHSANFIFTPFYIWRSMEAISQIIYFKWPATLFITKRS